VGGGGRRRGRGGSRRRLWARRRGGNRQRGRGRVLDVFVCCGRVRVQPDTVCEVGGSTPGLSPGDLGIFLGGGQTEEFVH